MPNRDHQLEKALKTTIRKLTTENSLPRWGWHDTFWITKRGDLDYERAQSHRQVFRRFHERLEDAISSDKWGTHAR